MQQSWDTQAGESLAKQRAAYIALALASLIVSPLSTWLLKASNTTLGSSIFAAVGLLSLAGAIGGTSAWAFLPPGLERSG